jgi:hypothetical protein
VPGIGYAFVPAAAGAGAAAAAEPWTGSEIETERYALRLDRGDGAVVSLVHRETGRELVRAGGHLNGLAAAVLSGVVVERLPGVGVCLRARRVTPRSVVRSSVTLYHALPWVDLTNELEAGEVDLAETACEFDVAEDVEEVRWDVAGGALGAVPPVAGMTPLRWLALRGPRTAVLVAVRGASAATFDGTRLVLRGDRPVGGGALLQVRLAARAGFLLADDPWRFGFSLEPLLAVPAPGTGARRLPTFGRLFDVPDPAVAVVGVKPADDGIGIVLYLMDLAGLERIVPVRPGVLTFDGATLTDLTEHDRTPADLEAGGGALVPLPGRGYAAVRLLGVRVA